MNTDEMHRYSGDVCMHTAQWFQVSCPDCTFHTAINHMITVLEGQILV